jgi:medium-chain acyl-[acyl-carrier-protein] hydrolase
MNSAAAAIEPWIPSHKRMPESRLRMFCFPYAGAGVSIFRHWSEALPAEVEVCPIQLPGRGTRLVEPPFVQLSPLVDALAQALAPLLDKPFVFFGHSLGALIGFELARRLRGQYGVHPARLLVSALRAPQLPDRGAPVHALPEGEFIAELSWLNGTPSAVLKHKELMEIVLPVLRADFALYENYEYASEPPLNCPISAFGGTQDCRVSESDLEAWRVQTNVSFSLRMFPGDHFFLSQPLLLHAVSEELRLIH